MYTVAAYEIDMAYGGPEEGGWYYGTGQYVRTLKTVKTRDEAHRIARRANSLMARLQKNHRPVSSVTYGGGRYSYEVYKGKPPSFYPEHRPYYS
jgi:hypothetical protein